MGEFLKPPKIVLLRVLTTVGILIIISDKRVSVISETDNKVIINNTSSSIINNKVFTT